MPQFTLVRRSFTLLLTAASLLSLPLAACSNDDDDTSCGPKPTGTTCQDLNGSCSSYVCSVGVWGCPGDEAIVPDTAASCGVVADSGTSVESDGGACASVPDLGKDVSFQAGTGTPPTGAGGSIADGTYVLTSDVTYFTGDAEIDLSSLGTVSSTIVIAGTTVDSFESSSLADEPPTLTSATFRTAGTTFTTTDTCPDTSSETDSYTATATSLMLIETQAGQGTVVITFAKQ